MADLIDRRAVIDTLHNVLADYIPYLIGRNEEIPMQCAVAIRDLPSVQQWIPCSERMPKEREWIGTKKFGTTISDDVYVTFECPDGSRYVKGIRFQNGKVSSYEQITGAVPIAWMPLPEPYKGNKND